MVTDKEKFVRDFVRDIFYFVRKKVHFWRCKDVQSLAVPVFMNYFQNECQFFLVSDKIEAILSEKRPILSENSFFRTNFGQKFVKFAQETLAYQMNISGSVSDK